MFIGDPNVSVNAIYDMVDFQCCRHYVDFMKKFILLLAFLLPSSVVAEETECVILLHGVMRSSHSMEALERDLIAHEYQVINVDYPSTSNRIEVLAQENIPPAMAKCNEGAKINFVTHSMGGILVRAYFKANPKIKPHRVVMIAPPNKGSEVIDDQAYQWFGGISGDSGAQLGTGEDSLPNQLGPVDYEVGIIAGSASVNPVFSDLIPGPDDGAVAVARTHVEGETDWIEVKATHSFMKFNRTVRRQTIEFLKNGKFAH